MDIPTQQPLIKVLDNYNIEVHEITTVAYKEKKGVWKINSSEGIKYLKMVSNSEKTLKFTLSAINHLTQNGILIPKINLTKDNSEYVKLDGLCFVLSDSVEGTKPNFNNITDFHTVVKGLAKFHKASLGFFPSDETKPKNGLGLWINNRKQQIEFMNEFYEYELSKNDNSAAGKLILDNFPYFYSRAIKSIDTANRNYYFSWVDKAKQLGSLCHQDYASSNLLIDTNGNSNVLDCDSIMIDIPSRDIRKLLNKIMKKLGTWNYDLTKKFIYIYQSINPLTNSQWYVVKLDLMFPHLFFGAMSKYYYQKDKEWSDEKYIEKIRQMCELEKSAQIILNRFDEIFDTDEDLYTVNEVT